MTATRRPRRVDLLPAVEGDLRRLAEDDPRLALRARAYLGLIESGGVEGQPLRVMAKYGDLGDCRKVYFGVADAASHRIVYRTVDSGEDDVDVFEVVEELPEESERELKRVHQQNVAKRGAARKSR